MRVLVTGATGMIGLAVADGCEAAATQLVATVARSRARPAGALGDAAEVHAWPDPTAAPPPAEALAASTRIVHLLGEPVAQRWTEEARGRIRELARGSRPRSSSRAFTALPESERPGVLVSQSATGYYGDRGPSAAQEDAPAGRRTCSPRSSSPGSRPRGGRPPPCAW